MPPVGPSCVPLPPTGGNVVDSPAGLRPHADHDAFQKRSGRDEGAQLPFSARSRRGEVRRGCEDFGYGGGHYSQSSSAAAASSGSKIV